MRMKVDNVVGCEQQASKVCIEQLHRVRTRERAQGIRGADSYGRGSGP